MQITREADYAVRVVLDLVEHAGAVPVRSAEVARRQLVPQPFLRKVVQTLARSGYVTTHRGTGGGITLAREPDSITLRGIIEAIDGPIALNRCAAQPGACPLERRCVVHPVWRRIRDLLVGELERTTIASLRHQRTV